MGCCASRKEDFNSKQTPAKVQIQESLPTAEIKIQNEEKKLHFARLDSKEIIKSLKTESMKEALSMPQLKRAFLELGIPLEILSELESPENQVLKKIKNEAKLYDLKKLSL